MPVRDCRFRDAAARRHSPATPGWCRRPAASRRPPGRSRRGPTPPLPRVLSSLTFCLPCRTGYGRRSDWSAPCRRSRWRRRRRCWPASAPSGRAVRRRRPRRRTRAGRRSPRREKFLDDRRDGRRASGQRAHHRVLGVAERRLGLDRHRRVVDVPTRQPGRLVQVVGSAQQRDVGQPGRALARHGRRRGSGTDSVTR